MTLGERILALPFAYRLLGRVAGTDSKPKYVRDYLKPQPGARVLDLGCGPGDILAYLPDCHYVGIDMDAGYIAAAQQRFGARGTFRCIDVADFIVEEKGSFDLVMANGVLHHLDDRQADVMLGTAAQALAPGGRLVTLDGCFVRGQSRVAKALLALDRGRFVRREEAYVTLVRAHFDDVSVDIRHDLLALPYTLILMTCRRTREPFGYQSVS